MKYDVFISHSMADGQKTAENIHGYLDKNLLQSSYLATECARSTSSSLSDEIKSTINNCRKLLVIFTPLAIQSAWVLGEIEYARIQEKEIVVFCRQDVSRSTLPVNLLHMPIHMYKNDEDLKQLIKNKLAWRIPVIIPAAGKGSGLHPFNVGMPKILMPVGKEPILHRILNCLDSKFFSKVVILTDNFHEMIEYYSNMLKCELPIECRQVTKETLPSSLKAMEIDIPFLLYYCDIILKDPVDWKQFIERHARSHEILGTLMDSHQYDLRVGRIKENKGTPELIGEFAEKPNDSFTITYSINMAVSLFEPDFLNYVLDTDCSLYGDTLTRAMADGKKFSHYGYNGSWAHIQTLNDWYAEQEKHGFTC